jgi:sugar phosphate isomerase/epimerase
MHVTRRHFCSQIAATVPLSALSLTPHPLGMQPTDQGKQELPPRLIVSCNLYSFNQALTTGAMTLPEVMEYCASIGFDAVDPTGYYFAGYPTPPGDEAIYRIKHRAFRLGLDISGTGIRTDFAAPRDEDRASDLALTERWVEVAAKLGAPMLRVFAGHGTSGTTWTDARERVIAALEAAAAVGARHGVAIVLQNHQDVLRTADEVLEIRRRIPSEWLGLNVDIGSLRTGDPYEEIARLAPFAYTWQIKELVYRRGREEKTNLQTIVRILRESSYRGFVPLETLGEGDARQKVRRLLDEFREAL